jgi:hypothetical protein
MASRKYYHFPFKAQKTLLEKDLSIKGTDLEVNWRERRVVRRSAP